MKNSDIFHISAQNIDSGYSLEPPRWGGSNEYPRSMFWAEIRKLMYTPVNPSFTIEKWGLRGSKLYRHVFVMALDFYVWWSVWLGQSAVCKFEYDPQSIFGKFDFDMWSILKKFKHIHIWSILK